MTKLKRGFHCAGCVLLWFATALSIGLEVLLIIGILGLEEEITRFGPEQNPYVVEDVWTLSVVALANLLPLLLFLIFAILCTRKLHRKKGIPCTPNN